MVIPSAVPRWIEALTLDELRFLRSFLLASGSLKDLAGQYEVSYPTIRNRLDLLIEKVRQADEEDEVGPIRAKIRSLVRAGDLDVDTARQILDAYTLEQKGKSDG